MPRARNKDDLVKFSSENYSKLIEMISMNVMFWKKHQNTSLTNAQKMFSESHKKLMSLVEKYSNEELFTKGYFSWTGNVDLGSYFVSTTSSHYDWAIKKIKAHCKKVL